MQSGVQQPKKQLYQGLIGATAGLLVSSILQPLEIIKMHIIINPLNSVKLQKNAIFYNLFKSAQYIYRYEGIRGFYRGVCAALIRVGLTSSIYFQLLAQLSPLLRNDKHNRMYSDFTSSFLARGLANFLTNPMLVVETRQEIPGQNDYKGVLNCIMKLHREEGLRVFIRGAWTCTIKEASFAGIYYVIFQQLKNQLNLKLGQQMNSIQIQFMAGMIAGMVGTTASQPFEIIRARLQAGALDHNATHTYTGLLNGIMKIQQTEGYQGFYQSKLYNSYLKGLAPRLIRKPLANTMTFVMVDQINQFYFGQGFDQ